MRNESFRKIIAMFCVAALFLGFIADYAVAGRIRFESTAQILFYYYIFVCLEFLLRGPDRQESQLEKIRENIGEEIIRLERKIQYIVNLLDNRNREEDFKRTFRF